MRISVKWSGLLQSNGMVSQHVDKRCRTTLVDSAKLRQAMHVIHRTEHTGAEAAAIVFLLLPLVSIDPSVNRNVY